MTILNQLIAVCHFGRSILCSGFCLRVELLKAVVVQSDWFSTLAADDARLRRARMIAEARYGFRWHLAHLHNRQSRAGGNLVLHRGRIPLAHFSNPVLGPRGTWSLLGRLPYHRRRLDREGDSEDPSRRRGHENLVSLRAKVSTTQTDRTILGRNRELGLESWLHMFKRNS